MDKKYGIEDILFFIFVLLFMGLIFTFLTSAIIQTIKDEDIKYQLKEIRIECLQRQENETAERLEEIIEEK